MRSVPAALLLFLIAVSLPVGVFADGGRVTIGAETGAFFPFFTYAENDGFEALPSWIYGMHVSYGVSDRANIQAGWMYTMGRAKADDDEEIKMAIQNIQVLSKWNLLTGQYRPFVSFGLSYYIINIDAPWEDDSSIGPSLGAGMEFVFTKNLSAGLYGGAEYIFAGKFDSVIGVSTLAFLNFTF